jgi:hypothetical protein
MLDNDPHDHYFYEVIVETGPLANHGTTSNIFFTIDGAWGDTGERCFTDPDRVLFNPGELDSFLMAVDAPLGELNYIRVFNDNSGLDDNGSWYLSSVTVQDVQTGKRSCPLFLK